MDINVFRPAIIFCLWYFYITNVSIVILLPYINDILYVIINYTFNKKSFLFNLLQLRHKNVAPKLTNSQLYIFLRILKIAKNVFENVPPTLQFYFREEPL